MASSDLVALTLLPWSWWRHIGERLRTGWPPRDLLDALLAERPLDPTTTAADLRSRAARALSDAARLDVAAVSWDAAEYPPSLSAIADPPAVLWVAGCREVLRSPAVAIVGSRAG